MRSRLPDDARDHDRLADLAELAPLGVLAPEEHGEVASHLAAGCARCEARAADGWRSLDVLAAAGPRLPTSDAARERLLASLPEPGGRAAPPRRGRRARTALVAAAAALVAALAGDALLALQRQTADARREARVARDALAAHERRVDALARRLDQLDGALRAAGDGARAVALAGESRFVAARARVVMDASGQQVLLLASRLPPAPAGHTYQLWVIVSGEPRSLGIFEPDADGRVLHVESGPLPEARDVKVAVSVEPSGGVPAPTGPIVLASP